MIKRVVGQSSVTHIFVLIFLGCVFSFKNMMDREKQLRSEAFDAYERIRPILEEYFDNWIIMAHRAGCSTKVVLGDISKDAADMKEVHSYAKKWKTKPLADIT